MSRLVLYRDEHMVSMDLEPVAQFAQFETWYWRCSCGLRCHTQSREECERSAHDHIDGGEPS